MMSLEVVKQEMAIKLIQALNPYQVRLTRSSE